MKTPALTPEEVRSLGGRIEKIAKAEYRRNPYWCPLKEMINVGWEAALVVVQRGGWDPDRFRAQWPDLELADYCSTAIRRAIVAYRWNASMPVNGPKKNEQRLAGLGVTRQIPEAHDYGQPAALPEDLVGDAEWHQAVRHRLEEVLRDFGGRAGPATRRVLDGEGVEEIAASSVLDDKAVMRQAAKLRIKLRSDKHLKRMAKILD